MQDGDEIVILLCADFKDRQNNDLDAAEKYRADYLRSKNMAAHDIEKLWENLLKEDIGSRVQIIQEIHELILSGEIEVAKGMLRTLIKVTCGYPAISDEAGRNSKSIMRMLSPDVDPGVKAFMAVVRAAERQSEKAAARGKIH
ncbi:TPA: hypothetical protein N2G22_002426 [Salmonella enterica]|nr:hypothetical protein [Salmonella enterica]